MRRKYFSGGFTGQSLPERLETQLSVQKDSYPANAKSLTDPAVLTAGAEPSFRPTASATALKSAVLGLLMLVVGCATGPVRNPVVLPQRTAIAEIHQNMDISPGMYPLGEFDNNRPTVIFIHGADRDSPKEFRYNYERYVLRDAAFLSDKTSKDRHSAPLSSQVVVEAVDAAIRSFAKGSPKLRADFKDHFLKASMVTNKKETTALIGKRGQVKDTTISADHQSGTADVYAADSGNPLGTLKMKAVASPLEQAIKNIKEMETQGLIQNKPAGQVILNMFNQIQELGSPDFFTFNELFADVFGFASARPGTNAIALHKALEDNPVAISHEVGEYLVQLPEKVLGFKLDGNVFQVTLSGVTTSFVLEGEALAIAQKGIQSNGTYNPHYGLRALQRICFGQKDRDLTETIQKMQEANVKDKAAPTRGGIDINLANKLAVETTSKSLSAPSDTATALSPDIILGIKPLIISIHRLNPHN